MTPSFFPGGADDCSRDVKFIGTEYEQRYPDLKVGVDIQVDANGFIIAEPATLCRFLARHYRDSITLKEIQIVQGKLEQNPDW